MTTLTAPRRSTSGPTRRRRRTEATRAITPQDLLRFQYVSDAQVSPDGRHVVFVRKTVGDKNQYVHDLWLVSRAERGWGDARAFTAGGKDTQPRWSPDGGRVAFVGARDKHKPQIYVIAAPPGGGEATALTRLPEGSLGSFRWSPDGRWIALSFRLQDPEWTEQAVKKRQEAGLSDPPRVLDHHWYRLDGDGYFNAQRYELYLVDTATGDAKVVYGKDTLGFFSFDFSPDSRQLVISSNADRRAGLKAWNDELLRFTIATGKITRVPNLPQGPKDAVRWSPDGKLLAYAGREGPDGTYSTENLELWVCDPVKGGGRSLTAREDYCLMASPISDTADVAFHAVLMWSPDSRRVYAQIGWHGEMHLAAIPAGGGKVVMLTGGQRVHSLGNVSADGKCAALTVGSATRLDEVHVADLQGTQAATQAVTDLNRDLLSELELVTPESHWVTSPDAARVQVWVLRPAGARSGRRPAILEVHGGPHAQYGVGFFHELQLLAANGYVVVYSNPRGSKGYGRDHCAAIRGDWGGADWIDVQAVTEFMRRDPGIDPKRMGIMGGSYGGFMTNWAIGHTREFAAAITDRCVSNLVSMYGSSDFIEPPDQYWEGAPWDRPEKLWDGSPLKYLSGVKTPTLIIHSEGDLRCNIEQAEQVFTALKVQNVPTRLVRYPRSTSHGMSRGGPPDLRVHRLQQILDWWARYLRK